MRKEMIQSVLDKGASYSADSEALATATVSALTALVAEISPIVGELAWRALYVRSLHLARSSFARPEVGNSVTSAELLALLHRDLQARAPVEARAAAEALLLALADLLASLIGEPLTHRLLHSAWDQPIDSKTSQEKQQ